MFEKVAIITCMLALAQARGINSRYGLVGHDPLGHGPNLVGANGYAGAGLGYDGAGIGYDGYGAGLGYGTGYNGYSGSPISSYQYRIDHTPGLPAHGAYGSGTYTGYGGYGADRRGANVAGAYERGAYGAGAYRQGVYENGAYGTGW